MSRVNYQNWAVDSLGNVVQGAAVEVRDFATNALVTTYTSEAGATVYSGVSDATGKISFWVAPGIYNILVGTSPSQTSTVEYLGRAQASPTDTTAGRLLAVGAFGLGLDAGISLSAGANLETQFTAGFYQGFGGLNANASTGDNPFPSSAGAFSLIIHNSSLGAPGEYITQIAVEYSLADSRFKYRTIGGTVAGWSAWREMLVATDKQTSTTDANVGRLMGVGAFGLGADAISYSGSVDDSTMASGFYFAGAGSTGTKPNTYGYLYHFKGTSRATQMWFREEGTTDILAYIRFFVSGTWTAWREMYHQGSIVGTVSQTGGVPTGAVVERASNANGEYVRLADGTQICRFQGTTSSAGAVTWTFPAAFAAGSTPQKFGTSNNDIARIVTTTLGTSTNLAFSAWNTAGVRVDAVSVSLLAIGRWY